MNYWYYFLTKKPHKYKYKYKHTQQINKQMRKENPIQVEIVAINYEYYIVMHWSPREKEEEEEIS